MRQFNVFSALWRAPLFNRALYQDVALRWKGIGLRYVFLILLVTWFIQCLRVTLSFTHYINTEAPTDLKDFPAMTLKSGHLSSPVPQPYVKLDDRGHPIFILDTTGTVKSPVDAAAVELIAEADMDPLHSAVPVSRTGTPLLITGTELIQVQAGGTLRSTSLASFPDMTLDEAHLIGGLKTLRNCIMPIGFPIVVLFYWVYRLLAALVLALLGLVFASAFKARLSFAALLRLAMIAMTADLLIGCLFWSISFHDGFKGWILGHALSLAYMIYAVKVGADATRLSHPAFPVEIAPSLPAIAPQSSPPQQSDPLFP